MQKGFEKDQIRSKMRNKKDRTTVKVEKKNKTSRDRET